MDDNNMDVIEQAAAISTSADTLAVQRETDEDPGMHDVDAITVALLGRQGEHMTQSVRIDASAWLDQLPGCQLVVAVRRPTENVIYLPNVTVEGGVITWEITSDDTAYSGWGRAEVRAMLGSKIKKSAVFSTRVEPSLEGGSGEVRPPAPPDWVQQIMASAQAAENAAKDALDRATVAEKAATEAGQQAKAAAESVSGLAGFSLALEADNMVSIDYKGTK